MKRVKMILPLLAFVFAMVAALASVQVEAKGKFFVMGRGGIDECEPIANSCGSGANICTVSGVQVYLDGTEQECTVFLKQIPAP